MTSLYVWATQGMNIYKDICENTYWQLRNILLKSQPRDFSILYFRQHLSGTQVSYYTATSDNVIGASRNTPQTLFNKTLLLFANSR